LDHTLRRMLVAPLLEPHVVVGADAGEHRHLLAAQSGDAAAAASQVRQADLLGADQLAARPQVLADRVLAGGHPTRVRPSRRPNQALSLPGETGLLRGAGEGRMVDDMTDS